MTSLAAARAAYGQGQVTTTDPGRLVVDCYTRIVEDLNEAVTAIGQGNIEGWVTRLGHAQDIIMELRSSLRAGIWDGAETLADFYVWSGSQLGQALIAKDAGPVTTLAGMYNDLRSAWAQAVAG